MMRGRKKVFASFKPPTGREQARHVRRGKGRVRTQDLGHQSGACYQLRYRPGDEGEKLRRRLKPSEIQVIKQVDNKIDRNIIKEHAAEINRGKL